MERKEAIDIIKKNWPDSSFTMLQEALETLIPELKESEDEKIRKGLIDHFSDFHLQTFAGLDPKKILAWLEKQCSKDNTEDIDILHRFSFYSYKDEPNVLYLSGLYVNEECRNKGIGTKILEITDEVAKSLNCHTIRLKTKKDSNAERLYKTHGYNSLKTEERDGIWLERQNEHTIICSEEQMDELENEYLKSIPKY